ncbi:type I restriction-modification system methyltransferase subunit [Clostridium sp. SY8519]|jgi:hypothetical protein|nr:type I restriction-modification system methyltransferase subunit [Clostridium sp. SY8519]
MIRLLNVKKIDNLIVGNYCYEDKKDVGSFRYNIETDSYESVRYNAQDEKYNAAYGFGRIIQLLRQMVEYNTFPDHMVYMWY